MKKPIALFLILSGVLASFVSSSFGQVAYPTKLTLPQAYQRGPEIYGQLPISVGPFDNYLVSPTNGFLETDICVNPTNPNNFVFTDNRVTGFSGTPLIYYTTNGGVNWNQASVSSSQGDPAFTADAQGNFYLAALSTSVTSIWVYKSVNAGVTWSLIASVGSGQVDKEWIAADQTTGTYQNHVYIAFVNFSTGASVDVWRSTNNASTWSFVGNMGTGTPNPGPDIAVDRNGRVILAWKGNGGTQVRVSNNGGASFGGAVTASNHTEPGTVHTSGRYVLKGDVRVNGMPHIAIDMTTGPYSGYIYNVYATNPPGPDNADIYCTRSTDNGATWSSSSPVRVNDDATTRDQFMADVSVDNQGRVWVMWWDSRDDASNNLIWTYGAVSTDAGLTFTNFAISNQSFNPASVKINQGTHYYMGDYQGISGKTFTFPGYSGQNNTRQDFTAYLPDWGISFAITADYVAPGGSAFNRVRIPVMGPYAGTVTFTPTVSPSPSPGTINFNWSPSNVKVMNGAADSIGVTAVVSANVPTNVYTVTINSVESGGPRTHQRTYTLNVNPIYTGIEENGIPVKYALTQNYPNPFNPVTVISYQLPANSFVTLKVYDIMGKEVATLVNEMKQAGTYDVNFEAANLPSGTYFYRMIAGSFTDVKKMTILK
jgi:hypothetical protein